jgi:predicted nucleic acid-binding protein
MRAVDTNALVRLITRDDPDQVARAEKWVESGGWVSHLALAEASWVLGSVYGLKPRQIAKAVEMLLDHQQLAIEGAEVVAAAAAQLRKTPRLRFSDCLMVEIARRAGHLPLGTFDRHLSKLTDTQML